LPGAWDDQARLREKRQEELKTLVQFAEIRSLMLES
jgi:hypothetical protein